MKNEKKENPDVIKMHHYTGVRHALAAVKYISDSKKKDGTLENLTGEEALNLVKTELYKIMQEMRKL